ncbi:MAG: hypothetical protein ACK53A_00995 [Gemmatimonadota bacterium]|jgi:hypothetical protein|nr:hypothetical protein [Gemmatimonadota bacterium]
MLRTIFTIGLLALLGLVALKVVFGLVGFAFGLLGLLLKIAIPVLLFAGVGYVALKIVAPDAAKRIKDGASGSSF